MTRRSSFPPISLKPYAGDSTADHDIFGTADGGGVIGWNGTKYKIKLLQAQFQLGTDLLDITGETQGNFTATSVKNTVMMSLSQLRGRITFSGYIPCALGIGLTNLNDVDAAGSVSDNEIDIEFLAGVGQDNLVTDTTTDDLFYRLRMIMEQISIDWNLDKPYIGVIISGQMTKAHADTSATGTSTNQPFIEINDPVS